METGMPMPMSALRLPPARAREWLAEQIEEAMRRLPPDAGAQWVLGWLLSQADMEQERADQIIDRCAVEVVPGSQLPWFASERQEKRGLK